MYAISLGDDGAELRPLEPWHADEFLAHIGRGRDFITRFIPFGTQVTDTASARAQLTAYANKRAADSGSLHGLWLGGELVGGLMFRTFDAATGVCEIGCWLEPAATGKGLVTRGARTLIDWAFDERGMHRVEWYAAVTNTASVNTARRLGMTREGVLREHYPYRGVRQDIEIWAVLAPEWRAARARTSHNDH
ncbi:GNAT family protein [Streptomyces griseoviridis]|jgi:RimJ/RimL family protein N-acetyltransferase|uniref:RimJ/RimL family protein N-acetyltransferase n=3 Tax=Streptomyces TaxID=1883 RepID=A0ABT9LKK9_STRGD|nr:MULTISPECIES: GNAT family protein [Streptomyces]MDP9684240.1 RimJ/RimL family protein N-acetyltransferase [Streptomyces griseoviridis]GGS59674.1 N-acetyltransferase [Streptomyces niveoruber]GGT02013.1 N-acetyltransferase [Streptomyces griseoviridis]GGU39298.1 N-acetyltransferase [Streptomyces daghestanicus]GHI30802.1 N-acetyltransferase [Streptomyces daghestanicus]